MAMMTAARRGSLAGQWEGRFAAGAQDMEILGRLDGECKKNAGRKRRPLGEAPAWHGLAGISGLELAGGLEERGVAWRGPSQGSLGQRAASGQPAQGNWGSAGGAVALLDGAGTSPTVS